MLQAGDEVFPCPHVHVEKVNHYLTSGSILGALTFEEDNINESDLSKEEKSKVSCLYKSN